MDIITHLRHFLYVLSDRIYQGSKNGIILMISWLGTPPGHHRHDLNTEGKSALVFLARIISVGERYCQMQIHISQIAKFMAQPWGPPGSCHQNNSATQWLTHLILYHAVGDPANDNCKTFLSLKPSEFWQNSSWILFIGARFLFPKRCGMTQIFQMT